MILADRPATGGLGRPAPPLAARHRRDRWIGTSFYFVALDNHLRAAGRGARRRARRGRRGVGDPRRRLLPRPEVHGRPAELPEPLHWFKWEAYTTWLSGFALLSSSTSSTARPYLVDADVSTRAWEAIAISLGAARRRVGRLRRALPRAPQRARTGRSLVAVFAFVCLSAWASRAARAAAVYIEVGAMLGTIMVGERLLRDHPGPLGARPREAGRAASPTRSGTLRGKQRSVHNNYLTLPVALRDALRPLPVHLRARRRAGSCSSR